MHLDEAGNLVITKAERPVAARLMVELAQWVRDVQEERSQREQGRADQGTVEGARGRSDHGQGGTGRIGDHGLGQQVPELLPNAGATGG